MIFVYLIQCTREIFLKILGRKRNLFRTMIPMSSLICYLIILYLTVSPRSQNREHTRPVKNPDALLYWVTSMLVAIPILVPLLPPLMVPKTRVLVPSSKDVNLKILVLGPDLEISRAVLSPLPMPFMMVFFELALSYLLMELL